VADLRAIQCLELLHHCWGLDSRLIDEIPILAVAAVLPEDGDRDAAELRVKESDRIAVMATQLNQGARVTELPGNHRRLIPDWHRCR